MIVEKLPEFFRFVRKVQSIVSHEMKDTKTGKQKFLIMMYYCDLGLIIIVTLIVHKQG